MSTQEPDPDGITVNRNRPGDILDLSGKVVAQFGGPFRGSESDFEKSFEKTDDIYFAITNIQNLGELASNLLAVGYDETELGILAEPIDGDGYAVKVSVQNDCLDNLDWDKIKETTEWGSLWLRCSTTHLFVAHRALRFLLLQMESLPICVWKDKYRVVVRELVAENNYIQFCGEVHDPFGINDRHRNHAEIFVRGYLERLVQAGTLAERLENLCKIELELDPSWLSLDSKNRFAKKGAVNSEGLNSTSRHILIAMLELSADKDSPQTATTIVQAAIASGDEKKVFKQLLRFGYVLSKKGPGGGYFLTDTGIVAAQKLKEMEGGKVGN